MPATTAPILAQLTAIASPAAKGALARYGIPATRALGVPMGAIKALAKAHGPDHDLACTLWPEGLYEAQILAIHLADPARMDAALMAEWCADFDNWALCDTAAFQLFDKTAARWDVACDWCATDALYIRRTGLAMIWALSVHDKSAPDTQFLQTLDWIEAVATDPRRHVHSAVSMALRATGKRNAVLHAAAVALCDRLGTGRDPTAMALGRLAGRELRSPALKIRT